ncbi:MAG: DDE-type integrase/transposase/recombinase, partial [Cyanobacteria bacterium P01_F01_bin.3]
FGPILAGKIRTRRASYMRQHTQWQWHLDEVFVKINGVQHYLWRAVDHEGEVLECFVTKRRDRNAALCFLKMAMKWYGNPEVVVTDRLASYRAAMKVIGNEDRQETARWANKRAEDPHLPFRRRERAMLRFRQMRSLQKFVAVHSSVHNHFNHQRNIERRTRFKDLRHAALLEWRGLLAA